jgi:anti-sigma factor RsiW
LNCDEFQILVHAYLDGELDLVRALEVERHLQGCVACERAWKGQQAMREALRDGSLYWDPPATLRPRIRKTLLRARPAGPSSARAIRWLSVAAALVFAVLATGVLVRLLSVPSANDRLAQEVLSSHLRSLMGHLIDKPSSNKHVVKPWFNGKVPFAPPVPDLADQGFLLVGGRLDYLNNQPVAALVYRRALHDINVFIWPANQASEEAVKPLTSQGYHLLHWTQAGMTFWAVSDLNDRELMEFVQHFRDAVAATPPEPGQ